MYAQIDPGRNICEFVSCAHAVSATKSFQRISQRKQGVCWLTQLHTHYVPTHEQVSVNCIPREQANGNDYRFTIFHQIHLHNNKYENTQLTCCTVNRKFCQYKMTKNMFLELKRFPLGVLRMHCLPPPFWAGRRQKSSTNWKVSCSH